MPQRMIIRVSGGMIALRPKIRPLAVLRLFSASIVMLSTTLKTLEQPTTDIEDFMHPMHADYIVSLQSALSGLSETIRALLSATEATTRQERDLRKKTEAALERADKAFSEQ